MCSKTIHVVSYENYEIISQNIYTYSFKSSKLNQSKNKNASKDLVPPDLWIHHDQMELKSLDKSSNSESTMTVTPIQRNSQELCHEPLLNTLEKKKSAYLGSIKFFIFHPLFYV